LRKRSNRKQTAVFAVIGVVTLAGVVFAVARIVRYPVAKQGKEQRINAIIKVPYGSVVLNSGTDPDKVAMVESQTDDPDENPSMHIRYTGNSNGTQTTLRITLGSDEGMLDRPNEIARGWYSSSPNFSPVSFSAVHTDAGSFIPASALTSDAPNSDYIYSPVPTAKSDNDISRIYLTRDIPISLYAEMGFGESLLDLTGLALIGTTIQTSTSRTRIIARSPNPTPMSTFTVNAGLGECTVEGICNFNCSAFDFTGGVGYYELRFNGNLQKNLEASVSIGCGKVVLNIPPESGRVQVMYDDNLFSSFSFQGLVKRREGFYTSVGFDQSKAPVLTLRLSSGVGKMIVNYH
jgi:hypothetical protein